MGKDRAKARKGWIELAVTGNGEEMAMAMHTRKDGLRISHISSASSARNLPFPSTTTRELSIEQETGRVCPHSTRKQLQNRLDQRKKRQFGTQILSRP